MACHQALLARLFNGCIDAAPFSHALTPSLCVAHQTISLPPISQTLSISHSQSVNSCLQQPRGEGFAISSFCVVSVIKKHPVLWMWKEPVFNFWETHKSLSLLSYLPQNWKQMLPFFIRLWTGQLWSCENKNHPVNLSCSLSSFLLLFPAFSF